MWVCGNVFVDACSTHGISMWHMHVLHKHVCEDMCIRNSPQRKGIIRSTCWLVPVCCAQLCTRDLSYFSVWWRKVNGFWWQIWLWQDGSSGSPTAQAKDFILIRPRLRLCLARSLPSSHTLLTHFSSGFLCPKWILFPSSLGKEGWMTRIMNICLLG